MKRSWQKILLLLALSPVASHAADIHISSITSKPVEEGSHILIDFTAPVISTTYKHTELALQHHLDFVGDQDQLWRGLRPMFKQLAIRYPVKEVTYLLSQQGHKLDLIIDTYIPSVITISTTKDKHVELMIRYTKKDKHRDLTRLLTSANDALQHRRFNDAIRLYTSLINTSDPAYRKPALERLGIAREKNGQLAHAKTLYQQYLDQYPTGDDSNRVRQRLADLLEAQLINKTLQHKTTVVVPTGKQKPRTVFGSFSQIVTFSNNDLNYTDNPVEQSIAMSSLDFFTRSRFGNRVARFNFNADHVYDLAYANNEGVDIRSLSLEYRSPLSGTEIMFGRQTSYSGGVLGRFDGIRYSQRVKSRWEIETVSGFPVDYGFEDTIQRNKRFVGGSLSYQWEQLNIKPYSVVQYLDGMIDRIAVGEELNYFTPDTFVRHSLDYDVHFQQWNLASVQVQQRFNKLLSTFALVDIRRSPLLETSNALISEFRADNLLELQDIISDELIEQQAKERTGKNAFASGGVNFDVTNDVFVRLDISWAWQQYAFVLDQTVETEQDQQSEASVQTGISNICQSCNDMLLMRLRYTRAISYDNYQSSLRYRFRPTRKFLIDPQLRLTYRDALTSTTAMLRPSVKLAYNWKKSIWNQLETGYEIWRFDNSMQPDYHRFFFNFIYRYVF